MRKALPVLGVLLALAAGCAGYGIYRVTENREAVVYTPVVSAGEPSAADGISLSLREQYGQHILWNSSINFADGTADADTEFSFSSPGIAEEYPQFYEGVMIYDGIDTHIWNLEHSDFETGAKQAMEDLSAKLQPGSEEWMDFSLSDYYTYYPLEININAPGFCYYSYSEIHEMDPGENHEAYVIQALDRFFRIPVLKEDKRQLDIVKDYDGNSTVSGSGVSENGDYYSFGTESVLGKDGCFFWFGNRSGQNRLVDTSLIPGGYGIYLLPFTEDPSCPETACDVDVDRLCCFYPLPEETRILRLSISKDQTRLMLYTCEEDILTLTVIDAQTGKCLQTLPLSAFDASFDYLNLLERDEYTLLYVGESRLLLLVWEREGLCRVAMDHSLTETEKEEDFFPLLNLDDCDICYTGDRLILTGKDYFTGRGNQGYYWRDASCGFCLAVYTGNDLAYYGVYESSLNKANNVQNSNLFFYAHDAVRPSYYRPVTIKAA